MRHIAKPLQPPASIRDYLANQTPVGHGLDYQTFSNTASPHGGSRGGQLCGELVSKKDLFGAAHREVDPLPIWPTDPSCETRFIFDILGDISAANPTDQQAADTISVLNLKHGALRGWREQAILTFVDGINTRANAELVQQFPMKLRIA